MQETRTTLESTTEDLPDDRDFGPIDYMCRSDLDNETPNRHVWRRYLVRLLGWWPDE